MKNTTTGFKVGDIIEYCHPKYKYDDAVEREIVEVRKGSYRWKYLQSAEIFDSRNSTDPNMEKFWTLKK